MYQQNANFMQNNPYYQYPYMQQYQRLTQMEQQQANSTPQYNMPAANQNLIKGRPVVSIEEARASQIDLDGSLFVFTDIGNKKIYTKQINLDGTATLNTYSLEDATIPTESFVTKKELQEAIDQVWKEINQKEKEITNDSIKRQQSNATKTAVCNKPTF